MSKRGSIGAKLGLLLRVSYRGGLLDKVRICFILLLAVAITIIYIVASAAGHGVTMSAKVDVPQVSISDSETIQITPSKPVSEIQVTPVLSDPMFDRLLIIAIFLPGFMMAGVALSSSRDTKAFRGAMLQRVLNLGIIQLNLFQLIIVTAFVDFSLLYISLSDMVLGWGIPWWFHICVLYLNILSFLLIAMVLTIAMVYFAALAEHREAVVHTAGEEPT